MNPNVLKVTIPSIFQKHLLNGKFNKKTQLNDDFLVTTNNDGCYDIIHENITIAQFVFDGSTVYAQMCEDVAVLNKLYGALCDNTNAEVYYTNPIQDEKVHTLVCCDATGYYDENNETEICSDIASGSADIAEQAIKTLPRLDKVAMQELATLMRKQTHTNEGIPCSINTVNTNGKIYVKTYDNDYLFTGGVQVLYDTVNAPAMFNYADGVLSAICETETPFTVTAHLNVEDINIIAFSLTDKGLMIAGKVNNRMLLLLNENVHSLP